MPWWTGTGSLKTHAPTHTGTDRHRHRVSINAQTKFGVYNTYQDHQRHKQEVKDLQTSRQAGKKVRVRVPEIEWSGKKQQQTNSHSRQLRRPLLVKDVHQTHCRQREAKLGQYPSEVHPHHLTVMRQIEELEGHQHALVPGLKLTHRTLYRYKSSKSEKCKRVRFIFIF